MKKHLNILILVWIVALGLGVSLRFKKEFYLSLDRARQASAQFLDVVEKKIFLSETKKILHYIQDDILSSREINLLFVGDIMLSRDVGKVMKAMNSYAYPFLKIADEIKEADLAFGNLENPISNRGKNQGSVYSFRADPKVIDGLKFAGFDILSLANNHIWDWGGEALIQTLDILKNNGIQSVGAGSNETQANRAVIFDIKNIKIAYLAYTNLYPESLEARSERLGISNFDLGEIEKKINNLKHDGVDIVIVSMHWGDEYQLQSNDEQQRIGRILVDAGANLVIGHHSHVVQEVEHYKNGYIAYSLGNFVFDQNFSSETMEGLMLNVVLKNNIIERVKPIKIKILETFQPYVE